MKKNFTQLIRQFAWLTAVLITTNVALAQNLDKIPQINPMGPDAAALFKTLERPLGTYTGTIPVNFPLYTFTNGPLSANISLDYNSTGGIRVEEVAGSAGLGFSFTDGGGRITQQIHGLPDDYSNGLLVGTKKPSTFSCSDMSHNQQARIPYNWDLEPDVFFYNFNGRSGKFVFRENGTIALSDNTGIKIEHFFGTPGQLGIRQWIITDEKGNKYYFGQNKAKTVSYWLDNTSTVWSMGSSAQALPNLASRSWYLTEIKDINEENTLKYTYVATGGELTTFAGGYRKSWTFGSMHGFNTTLDQAIVKTQTNEYLVSKIEGKQGYVLINSTSGRQDGWGRKINSIEAFDTLGVLKRKFKFNYGYFQNAGDKRLKLNDFSEVNIAGTDSITHRFQYEEYQNLPARSSNSVDFWGFYNGKYNTSYFPNLYYKYASYVIRDDQSSDRNPVPVYAQANILKKIIYPTGGSREFIYEGNKALQYTLYEHLLGDPEFTTNQSFTRTNFDYSTSPTPCLRQNFVINGTDGGAVFRYTLGGIGSNCNGYMVKLFVPSYSGDQYGGYELSGYSMNNQPTWSYELINGEYRIEVYKTSTACTFAGLTGSWKESTLSTASVITPTGGYNRNNTNVGGVRIKELRDYDPVSTKTNTTEYRYKLYSTDSALTSGVLITPVHMVSYENPGSWDGQHLAVQTSSCYPLATSGGSYVVYPEVRTVENGNGWTDRNYSYIADPVDNNYPAAPTHDYSYARGSLMGEKVFNQSGQLLRKTIYSYWTGYSGGQMGVRFKPYYYDIQDNGGEDREWPRNQNELPWHSDCRTFYTNVGSIMPGATIDSVFTNSGIFVTKTENIYQSYDNHLFLTKIKKTINNNQTSITTLRYPFTANAEFTFGLSGVEPDYKTVLLGLNYLQPMEIVDSIKPQTGTGTLLGGSKFLVAPFPGGKYHLTKVRTYTSATNFNEISLSEYDVNGNLCERYRTGDARETYLWGYKNTYPVAKVTGSNYATVAALANNNVLQNPNATDQMIRAELNKIRIGLANTTAQVISYTYNPLVGMTSMTDPSGRTTYYEYDGFQRLKLLKDHNGKIVKHYQYNYKP